MLFARAWARRASPSSCPRTSVVAVAAARAALRCCCWRPALLWDRRGAHHGRSLSQVIQQRRKWWYHRTWAGSWKLQGARALKSASTRSLPQKDRAEAHWWGSVM